MGKFPSAGKFGYGKSASASSFKTKCRAAAAFDRSGRKLFPFICGKGFAVDATDVRVGFPKYENVFAFDPLPKRQSLAVLCQAGRSGVTGSTSTHLNMANLPAPADLIDFAAEAIAVSVDFPKCATGGAFTGVNTLAHGECDNVVVFLKTASAGRFVSGWSIRSECVDVDTFDTANLQALADSNYKSVDIDVFKPARSLRHRRL